MTLSALLPTIISACFTALVSGITVYVSLSNRMAITETKIDTLTKRVEKHNQIVERTYIVERDIKTAFKQLEEIKADIHTLEQEQRKCVKCSK